jgi:hypothetical protein
MTSFMGAVDIDLENMSYGAPAMGKNDLRSPRKGSFLLSIRQMRLPRVKLWCRIDGWQNLMQYQTLYCHYKV